MTASAIVRMDIVGLLLKSCVRWKSETEGKYDAVRTQFEISAKSNELTLASLTIDFGIALPVIEPKMEGGWFSAQSTSDSMMTLTLHKWAHIRVTVQNHLWRI